MSASITNPASNKLKPGLTMEKVKSAIQASGYPLQITISASLQPSFLVQEEWAYSDRITGESRAIHMLAETRLSQEDINKYRVRPTLSLIIECKQCDLPYVFFLSERVIQPKFPLLAGLPSEDIVIQTDDDQST
jgi:hypothetical protein